MLKGAMWFCFGVIATGAIIFTARRFFEESPKLAVQPQRPVAGNGSPSRDPDNISLSDIAAGKEQAGPMPLYPPTSDPNQQPGSGGVTPWPGMSDGVTGTDEQMWNLTPEWVRRRCTILDTDARFGCILHAELEWYNAHPKESLPWAEAIDKLTGIDLKQPIAQVHKTAPIVDGPAYLAQKAEAELAKDQANSRVGPDTAGQPHADGNGIAVDPDTIPTGHPDQTPASETDAPACMAALQVLGHDGESFIEEWNAFAGRNLDTSLALAQKAEMYVTIASRVLENDAPYCDRVNRTLPRIYPARLDEHDRMSSTRLIMALKTLKIAAASKATLEAQASRDVGH